MIYIKMIGIDSSCKVLVSCNGELQYKPICCLKVGDLVQTSEKIDSISYKDLKNNKELELYRINKKDGMIDDLLVDKNAFLLKENDSVKIIDIKDANRERHKHIYRIYYLYFEKSQKDDIYIIVNGLQVKVNKKLPIKREVLFTKENSLEKTHHDRKMEI
jgi:hypothetical protein